MIQQFTVYDLETGAIRSVIGATSPTDVWKMLSTPPGCGLIEGEHDKRSKRVNVDTLVVEDWRPPQPSSDHVWNEVDRLWELCTEAESKMRDRAETLAALEAIDIRKVRALTDYVLAKITTDYEAAMERLRALEAEAVEQRSKLK